MISEGIPIYEILLIKRLRAISYFTYRFTSLSPHAIILMRTNLRKTAENSWSATFCSDFVSWSRSHSSVKNQYPLRIRFNSHRNNIFYTFPANLRCISPKLPILVQFPIYNPPYSSRIQPIMNELKFFWSVLNLPNYLYSVPLM